MEFGQEIHRIRYRAPAAKELVKNRRDSDDVFDDMRAIIENEFSYPDLCLAKVAEDLRYSPRYLIYLCARRNTSFSDLLWTKRLEHAAGLLDQTMKGAVGIGEIAQSAGFKSAAHFTRAFKALYGVTPTRFRKTRASRL